jgi:hypothetical protein
MAGAAGDVQRAAKLAIVAPRALASISMLPHAARGAGHGDAVIVRRSACRVRHRLTGDCEVPAAGNWLAAHRGVAAGCAGAGSGNLRQASCGRLQRQAPWPCCATRHQVGHEFGLAGQVVGLDAVQRIALEKQRSRCATAGCRAWRLKVNA